MILCTFTNCSRFFCRIEKVITSNGRLFGTRFGVHRDGDTGIRQSADTSWYNRGLFSSGRRWCSISRARHCVSCPTAPAHQLSALGTTTTNNDLDICQNQLWRWKLFLYLATWNPSNLHNNVYPDWLFQKPKRIKKLPSSNINRHYLENWAPMELDLAFLDTSRTMKYLDHLGKDNHSIFRISYPSPESCSEATPEHSIIHFSMTCEFSVVKLCFVMTSMWWFLSFLL